MYGSEFLVNGVQSIARLFEWDDRIVSVSLVAIGTSLPELATSLVAAFRKESNLAIGNLIGSNIFNVLAVLGITSIIHPIEMMNENLFIDYLWMMISVIILGLFIYVFSKKQISRTEGLLLLIFYIVFMFFLF
ncbi:MAG: sodium:calcium antiporter, partial [Flavobacteriales bacterium]|nr:sodium:calcium antiporter [Flavobacteriales bacterium]